MIDNNYQKDWFNRHGKDWFKSVSNPFYENLMMKMLPKIKGDVLEIGAGRFSPYLAKIPEVKLTIGDISETMLKITGLKIKKKVLDIENIPYPDKSFDYVVSFGILHHVNNPQKAIAECVRVARKGVFFMIEMNPLYIPYSAKLLISREKVEYGILKLPVWKYKKILKKLRLKYKITMTDLGNHRMSRGFFLLCRKIEFLFRPFLSHINIYISSKNS
jgi:ubiquinone/menaquinone biosynthesis C-methylase UbiE